MLCRGLVQVLGSPDRLLRVGRRPVFEGFCTSDNCRFLLQARAAGRSGGTARLRDVSEGCRDVAAAAGGGGSALAER